MKKLTSIQLERQDDGSLERSPSPVTPVSFDVAITSDSVKFNISLDQQAAEHVASIGQFSFTLSRGALRKIVEAMMKELAG